MRNWRWLLPVAVIAAAAAAIPAQEAPDASSHLRVYFFDVGQGDGALIQTPSGQNVIYDAGDSPKQVRDYLAGLGVTTADLVIASHNHSDHIGGMAEVLKELHPRFYMDNAIPATTATQTRVLEAVAAAGSQLLEPTSRRITFGDVALNVVPPPGIPDWDQNDNSIGLTVEYGSFRMSLAGDAEPREWAWWTVNYPEWFRVPVQVHKASHHGSNNGDTAVALGFLKPRAVVVSAGQGNSYGHPDREALQKYAAVGAMVYRTDLNGSVVVEADSSGAYTITVERGEGAQPPPPSPAPAPPAPAPLPSPLPSPVPSPSPSPSPAPSPSPRQRVGAICNDGSLSSATGSGACSSHGGVRCWRYSDGTCTNP